MTNENSIIRQAENALNLLITGAVRTIEDQYENAADPKCQAALTRLADILIRGVQDWDLHTKPQPLSKVLGDTEVVGNPPAEEVKLTRSQFATFVMPAFTAMKEAIDMGVACGLTLMKFDQQANGNFKAVYLAKDHASIDRLTADLSYGPVAVEPLKL